MIRICLILILLLPACISKAQPARPFPQHVQYCDGSILPHSVSQHEMDNVVKSFYEEWKRKYVRKGCHSGEAFVWYDLSGKIRCVSEGQGYGMMIVALMAGIDDSAQYVFNGMLKYYRAHPSGRSDRLMAWAQTKNCRDVDTTSATDGDLDIAYALLLADTQWGSLGTIDYRKEATEILEAIWYQDINQKSFSILLSNAVEYDSKDYFDMRTSDFMPAHFKSFELFAKDGRWKKVIDQNYAMFQSLQEQYSPDAGLLPDFVGHIDQKPRPAHARFKESRFDGMYNYNACRIPWRLATDYLLYGDRRALLVLTKINRWLRETTKDNPDNISAGYSLAGDDLKNRHFEALSFIGPFAISAMIDGKNQPWLNSLWNYLVNFKLKDFDYYDNTIKLINLIILSGNYWSPK